MAINLRTTVFLVLLVSYLVHLESVKGVSLGLDLFPPVADSFPVEEAVNTAPPAIEHVPYDTWEDHVPAWQDDVIKCTVQLNTAWLTVKSLVPDTTLALYGQNQQCFGCITEFKGFIHPSGGNLSSLIQSNYGNTLEILNDDHDEVLCRSSLPKFRERGDYWLIVFEDITSTQNTSCELVLANDPANYNLPVLYAFLVYLGMAVIWIIIKKIYTHKKCRCKKNSHDFTSKTELHLTDVDDTKVKTKEMTPVTPETGHVKKRLRCLDTFRGFCLAVMIFVNYGGGGYWYFQHVHWDGLLVADLVFPWFTWIMGVSIAFAFRGMLKRGQPKGLIFLRVLKRAITIFAIGLFMGASGTPDVNTMRIPNVLQRLAFTYLVTASVHLCFASAQGQTKVGSCCRFCPSLADIVEYWPEWLVMLAILGLHQGLTYGLPVPGCPKGYLGPGGLHEGGKYFNCTGGAAGFIDRWILSNDHIYQFPTIKTLYKTTMAFDPEGVLGTLTSIFMCYLGLQAGKITTTYKSSTNRCVRWLVWGLITGAIGTILCKGTQTGGWVPLNKNLWSISFTLVLTSMAFIILIGLYLIIDVAKIWTGAPFIYPGMNSIVVYVCHSVLGGYFPVSWQWPDPTLHWQLLFGDLWGSTLWVTVAYAMYRNHVFISL